MRDKVGYYFVLLTGLLVRQDCGILTGVGQILRCRGLQEGLLLVRIQHLRQRGVGLSRLHPVRLTSTANKSLQEFCHRAQAAFAHALLHPHSHDVSVRILRSNMALLRIDGGFQLLDRHLRSCCKWLQQACRLHPGSASKLEQRWLRRLRVSKMTSVGACNLIA